MVKKHRPSNVLLFFLRLTPSNRRSVTGGRSVKLKLFVLPPVGAAEPGGAGVAAAHGGRTTRDGPLSADPGPHRRARRGVQRRAGAHERLSVARVSAVSSTSRPRVGQRCTRAKLAPEPPPPPPPLLLPPPPPLVPLPLLLLMCLYFIVDSVKS